MYRYILLPYSKIQLIIDENSTQKPLRICEYNLQMLKYPF